MTVAATPAFDPSRFTVKSDVTLPLLKVKVGTDYYVTLTGAMFVGKEIPGKATIDEKTGEITPAAKKEPAHLVHVVDLTTGKKAQMICSTVFRKELDEAYPNAGYVGKSFLFSIQKVEGKSYNLVQISEIEVTEPAKK